MTAWDFALDPYGRQYTANADTDAVAQRDQANEHYLLRVLDAPITIHRAFVELAGSLNAAAILSDLAAQSDLTELAGDWVYIDAEEWRSRLGLSYKEQLTARRLLERNGFLETMRIGMPPRTAVRVNWLVVDRELRVQAANAALARPSPSLSS
ncbi:hypothetical protein IPU70_21070 [Achromobacter sp. SD115]|jgi:hypothetical protein|uniref:Uncharacterized protein n=3 Tax=Achromobacter TaxID=222 RepID=A0A0D6ISB5_ALCXX|nr:MULTISPECIES: hypothetical protein [Achromobacter]AZS82056.1 hypothetical protein ELS24_28685 [Achromobacter spanius]EJO30879.1 hypothetical protein QWC_13487 [Achromobacter marplatensis]MBC9907778.1 hypothetical protein [Achromobacter xylosoxidans]MBD0868077.1 hypothetical protein [Achromobacter xylosoxidans]MBO1016069.1 hypothetical protein [Achromobacter sp. SD115]